ncbi:acyl-CoA thioesterase [Rhodococcus opacus]|uniref:acyl-CoA thioesterase n=1 Tax=Rhodococcus opacus TaxID=37919 RepID=UPI00155A0769|nr:thioesterase family protein [Rhodococcus opacus]
MSAGAPVHRHRVRYHEVDAQGILYNSRYWEIVDAAMTEFFRELGWTYPELNSDGMDPSLIQSSARFLRPAGLDEEIDVAVTLTHLGTTSFALDFGLRAVSEGTPIAELGIVYVNFDPTTRQKRPIPDQVRERLEASVDTITERVL